MEKEYVMEIARTIREQLVSLTPMGYLFKGTAYHPFDH